MLLKNKINWPLRNRFLSKKIDIFKVLITFVVPMEFRLKFLINHLNLVLPLQNMLSSLSKAGTWRSAKKVLNRPIRALYPKMTSGALGATQPRSYHHLLTIRLTQTRLLIRSLNGLVKKKMTLAMMSANRKNHRFCLISHLTRSQVLISVRESGAIQIQRPLVGDT